MYCTVKEIIREVLDTDVPDSECVFAVVLTRGDVRHIAQDWNLPDDELETVMQRLDDAFEHGRTRSDGRCVTGAGRGAHVMNISTETREILRNYKAVINARRREMGQKPLTTAQIVDEICDFVVNQQAVFLGGHYILQGCRNR